MEPLSPQRNRPDRSQRTIRSLVEGVPAGFGRLSWYAPAVLWSVSAIGSGSVLFTPRVAARYEYELLWIALVTCVLMWSLIRESARYAIVTGRTMLDDCGPDGCRRACSESPDSSILPFRF
jgi:hypothetical protein